MYLCTVAYGMCPAAGGVLCIGGTPVDSLEQRANQSLDTWEDCSKSWLLTANRHGDGLPEPTMQWRC